MRVSRSIELLSASSTVSGSTFFSEPLACHETLIAEVRNSERGELFCHRYQTDQLHVISGSLDLIVLQDRRLRCIHLRDDEPIWLRIPPGVPHGAINRSSRPAVVVNAVLRHGASDPRDYQPRAIPRALAREWSELQAA
jgi:hypothetical protein